MDKKTYNAEYYSKNKEKILLNRKKKDLPKVGAKSKDHWSRTCFLYSIVSLMVFASTYEAYLFYRIEDSCEYAALKALVIEAALLGLPFISKFHRGFKCLGLSLVFFSVFVMAFSGVKEFSRNTMAARRLPQLLADTDIQLQLTLNRLEMYEKKGWLGRSHELQLDVKELFSKKAAIQADLDSLGAIWVHGFQLLLQCAFRLLLMISAWAYVGAVVRKTGIDPCGG